MEDQKDKLVITRIFDAPVEKVWQRNHHQNLEDSGADFVTPVPESPT